MRNSMYRVFAGLVSMIVIICAAAIGRSALETEQTTAPDPEPLVINTVEDGKAYGIIYINEEVLQ